MHVALPKVSPLLAVVTAALTVIVVNAEGPCTVQEDCTAGQFCGTDLTCHWFGCAVSLTHTFWCG